MVFCGRCAGRARSWVFAMTRETVDCRTPWTSASSSWGRLCRSQDQGQAHAQEQPQHPRPEDRQTAGSVNGLAQAHNLTPRDSRATIRHGGLLLGWIGLSTKDSLKSKPPPCLATRYYQQNTLNTPMNKPPCPATHPQHYWRKPEKF